MITTVTCKKETFNSFYVFVSLTTLAIHTHGYAATTVNHCYIIGAYRAIINSKWTQGPKTKRHKYRVPL